MLASISCNEAVHSLSRAWKVAPHVMPILVNGNFNDEPSGFKRLFEIVQSALDSSGDVTFDLRKCTWLGTNAVALLGGAARAVQAQGRQATFEWPQSEQLFKFLGKCDFRRAFDGGDHPFLDNSVPFRHNAAFDQQNLVTYLRQYWLGRGWLDVSDDLRNAIVGKMIEIYVNAFDHSGSHVGTVSCGQRYPFLKRLTLTVADFGVGIAGNVRQFLGRSIGDVDALKWAFESGNTTKPNHDSPRGVGLKLLRDFVSVNDGQMVVYANGAFATFGRNAPVFNPFPVEFNGTVFHLSLHCDNAKYVLGRGVKPAAFF